ncbi:MAG: XRE family transcriptional regulator [Candidatus Poribacteria bacterium]|nr:XRE family transcriptional regulator [Candidatus Poribacteria bacterium]
MNKEKIKYEVGSGNVFKDLGLPEPEERLAKARLVFIIDDLITERCLRRGKAAKILGISKSELSDLLDGLFDDFSVDYLLLLLRRLDHDVEVVLHRKSADASTISISVSTAA